MSNRKQRKFAVLAGGLATLLFFQTVPAVAQEDDSRNPFSFSASQSFYRDNNLGRLPDDKYLSPGYLDKYFEGKRSDTYSVTSLGVRFDTEVSRQAFYAGLNGTYTKYFTHSNLDNFSPDARLGWNWRVGDRWSGVLGYSYSGSRVRFEDVSTGVNDGEFKRVMRRLHRFNASADYWWHPDWATGVGYSYVLNNYDSNERAWDEYNSQEVRLNLTYRPSTGNRIVLGFIFEDGEYPNQARKAGSLREWERRDVQLSGVWRLTGVTQLNGYVGYTQRKYNLAPNRDFSGITGRIGFQWTPTGKAIISLSWRREIGADQDSVSNYAVSQGWSLQPTWIITSKISLGASYEYLDRSYGGDPGIFPPLWAPPPRDSKTKSYGIHFRYMPTSNSNITLGFRDSRRDAENYKVYDYCAQTWWLSGSMTF